MKHVMLWLVAVAMGTGMSLSDASAQTHSTKHTITASSCTKKKPTKKHKRRSHHRRRHDAAPAKHK